MWSAHLMDASIRVPIHRERASDFLIVDRDHCDRDRSCVELTCFHLFLPVALFAVEPAATRLWHPRDSLLTHYHQRWPGSVSF